jgi:hypothetical protein
MIVRSVQFGAHLQDQEAKESNRIMCNLLAYIGLISNEFQVI